jgi:hypothetical protein
MPSAVPYQQGLIGLYNNTQNNPGVYVSWDADTSFNSTQSIIFKGVDNSSYRFPLVVNRYANPSSGMQNLGAPIALGSGTTYIYCLNSDGIIAYQKNGDVFNTSGFSSNLSINSSFTPETIKVGSIGTTEIILVGFATFFNVLSFNGSSFTVSSGLNFENICGISSSDYGPNSFCFNNNKIFLAYNQEIYAGNISLNSQKNVILGTGTTGVIVDSSNGLTQNVINLACFDGVKLAISFDPVEIRDASDIFESTYEEVQDA